MAEHQPVAKKKLSADWLFQGVLSKVGDTLDRFTGRRWTPSSSLATSELIERLKKLLDAEAREIPGKGRVVPHNISLKMQWDKFSEDSEKAIAALRTELLTAAIDHINDSLYYTFAPIALDVKTDYFTEGVKLMVGFDTFDDEIEGVEMNVTIPSMNVAGLVPDTSPQPASIIDTYIARFTLNGVGMERRIVTQPGDRISVGRTGENKLVLDDVSVSKMHGSLVVSPDGSLAVADTGSTNGTFINGERIAYGKATALTATDRVRFGTVEVIFEHLPRPIVIEQEVDPMAPRTESFHIDGFEFISRETPDQPASPSDAASTHEESENISMERTIGELPVTVQELKPIAPPPLKLEQTMPSSKTVDPTPLLPTISSTPIPPPGIGLEKPLGSTPVPPTGSESPEILDSSGDGPETSLGGQK